MADDDTDRVEGVDFTEIDPALEELSYPLTADELVEKHGDRELGRTNADPITVRELFGHLGEASFESKEELRRTLLGQMPRDSVGRSNYSDRGGAHPVETDAAEEAEERTDADVEAGPSTDPDVQSEEDADAATGDEGGDGDGNETADEG